MHYTRRKTLKTLTTASLGLATAPGLLHTQLPGSILQEEKLGIALVGLGNYSQYALKPALYETQQVTLTGIVTGTPEKARQWSAEFDLPSTHIYNYKAFDRIADNEDIDIVYIVLPNFMHEEYTIRALEAGKHVICEKPMGMNAAECESMIAASEKAGRLLSVGYRLHYERHHQEAMRLGREKPFGPINFLETSFAYHVSDPTLWRLDAAKGGGGAIMDLGVYPIQACRYVAGEEPTSVTAQAFVHDTSRFKGIYETFYWQFEYPSGLTAHCATSYSSYVDRFYASCYRGWFELKPSFNGNGTSGATSDGPMNLPKVNQQASHMDDFANSILNNTPVLVDGHEGLRDLRIIDAIKKAVETGAKSENLSVKLVLRSGKLSIS